MPIAERGSIRFRTRWDLGYTNGTDEAIIQYDCWRPPKGTIYRYNPELKLRIAYDGDTLQPRDTDILLKGAKQTRERKFDMDELLGDLARQFGWHKESTVDLGDVPAHWRRVVECYKTTISYRPLYRYMDIVFEAAKEVAIDGVKYPAGDPLGGFRVLVPAAHRFVRSFEFNPKCCPGKDRVRRGDEFSDYHGAGAEEYLRQIGKLDKTGGVLFPPSGGPYGPHGEPYGGEDKVKGGVGDDTIWGDDGDDKIKGGTGDSSDSIYGGGGDDKIKGGSGH